MSTIGNYSFLCEGCNYLEEIKTIQEAKDDGWTVPGQNDEDDTIFCPDCTNDENKVMNEGD